MSIQFAFPVHSTVDDLFNMFSMFTIHVLKIVLGYISIGIVGINTYAYVMFDQSSAYNNSVHSTGIEN